MPVRRCGTARDAATLSTACVYVGPRSRYENLFRPGDAAPSAIGRPMDEEEATALFAATLRGPVGRYYAAWFARELHGLDLVCTCPLGLPCHADVLLCLANGHDTGFGPARCTTCSLEGP